jgi:hypothetical protein
MNEGSEEPIVVGGSAFASLENFKKFGRRKPKRDRRLRLWFSTSAHFFVCDFRFRSPNSFV